jgi:hypothetical protein
MIFTVLGIFSFVGIRFIPGLTGSGFYNGFWFSWLCFAAFVGMPPLLALAASVFSALGSPKDYTLVRRPMTAKRE